MGKVWLSHLQITIIAGVVTWWKWSLVGKIVLIDVSRIRSAAVMSVVERFSWRDVS